MVNNINSMLLSILFLPFVGAFLIKLLSPRHAIRAGFIILLLQLTCFPQVVRHLVGGKVWQANIYGVFADLLGVCFRCNLISLIFAFTSVFIGLFIYLFSTGYFIGEKEELQQTFAFWGLVFVGSMMGVVFSDNLISLYVFWQLAALCSWRLIGLCRTEQHLLKADKAFLITTFGAGLMMVSFACIYLQTGSFSLSYIRQSSVSPLVFTLFFLGVITASASFPFHIWLIDASVAPAPVMAFLNAAVFVNIGIYTLLRVFGLTLSVKGGVAWAGWLALLSSFIAGIVALREDDINKLLAFSTVNQLGLMIAGLLMFNAVAIRGVLIFYVAHALGAGSLFLCAGIAEKVFGTRDIKQMGGLMKDMPVVTYGFLIGMFSIIGIPPLPGSFGKMEIITGMLVERQVLFAFFAMLTTVLTLIYLFRLFLHVFMGENRKSVIEERIGFKPMFISVAILATVSILLGIAMVM